MGWEGKGGGRESAQLSAWTVASTQMFVTFHINIHGHF